MCLGLVVLLVIVISQNMGLQDKLKRLEARLQGMGEARGSDNNLWLRP
jgi:hypothetical protein